MHRNITHNILSRCASLSTSDIWVSSSISLGALIAKIRHSFMSEEFEWNVYCVWRICVTFKRFAWSFTCFFFVSEIHHVFYWLFQLKAEWRMYASANEIIIGLNDATPILYLMPFFYQFETFFSQIWIQKHQFHTIFLNPRIYAFPHIARQHYIHSQSRLYCA